MESQKILTLLDTKILTASVNGPAVSLAGLEGVVDVIAHAGTPGNGTGTASFQLQTSADGLTNWQNVGPVLANFTTAGGVISANLNPAACQQFIRCTATVAGTSPSFPSCVLGIGQPQYA